VGGAAGSRLLHPLRPAASALPVARLHRHRRLQGGALGHHAWGSLLTACCLLCRVTNASSDDLDDVAVDASVSDKKGCAAGDVSRACDDAKKLLQQVVQRLQQLHEELKLR
jgi:hypothetical protein